LENRDEPLVAALTIHFQPQTVPPPRWIPANIRLISSAWNNAHIRLAILATHTIEYRAPSLM
jgi:hypothetical protein